MPLTIWLLALAVAVIAGTPAHADPVVTPIVAAVTAVGGAVSAMGAAGTFLVNAGLALGASYLSRALGKKQKGASAASSAVTLDLSIDSDRPRTLVLGERLVAGSLHYFCKDGPQNENITLVIALADHEIDSLQMVWVNDRAISMHLDAAGWQDVPEFSDKYGVSMLSFRLYKGRADQEADPEVIANSGGQWTAAHRLRGCAYVKVRIVYNPDVWGGSLPTFKWLIRGAKLYDPRQDDTNPGGSGPMRWGQPETYVFADNLEVARYNFLRGIYVGGDKWFGVGLEASEINLSDFYAAAAACDEQVQTRAGTWEPRYRVAAIIDADEPWGDVLNKFSTACAGSLPDLSGQYSCFPGVAQVPVLHITDDDFEVGTELTGSRHRPFDEVVSEVTGSWASPEALYEITALPTRYSSADEEADGGFRRSASYDLSYVRSQSQGQRCMEIFRRLARRQISHKGTLRRRCGEVLEAGDWITWSSAKFGYDTRVFRVEARTPTASGSVTVGVREIDGAVYGWGPEDEQDPENPTDLPSGGAGTTVVVGIHVEIAQVNGIDGTQVPGIRVTWQPITDPTVYGLQIEYRRVGDAPWQSYMAGEAETRAGSATITAGILGGEFYQVRITPLTSPRRVVDISPVATTASNTVEVIVNRALVSTVTEAVRPGVVTNDAMDALLRQQFDEALWRNLDSAVIGLVSQVFDAAAHDEVQARATAKLRADVAAGLNPIGAGIERIDQVQSELTAALAQTQVNLNAAIAGVAADLQTEETTRANADQALTSTITTMTAQLGANIAYVQSQVDALVEPGATTARRADDLFVQDIQNADAATVALFIEAAQRGDDLTALKKQLAVSSASISEVQTATVSNGEAIASLSTTLTAETSARQAQVASEASARVSGDAASASYAQTIVAGESNARAAAVSEEQTARINGDGALASQITTVAAVANGATAQGQWGIALAAGADGAAATYRIILNAGAISSGLRIDAMSGGTSRVIIDAQAFYLRSATDGYLTPVFAYDSGFFYLGGNTRINGNLLVGGTVYAQAINDATPLTGMASTAGNLAIGSGSSGWMTVGSGMPLTVAPRNGIVFVRVDIRAGATLANSTNGTAGGTTYVRVLVNGAEVYNSQIFQAQAIPKLSQTGDIMNDFFFYTVGGSGHVNVEAQVRFDTDPGVGGSIFAKVGVVATGK
ncbi:hypothetical protein DFO45_2305 [Azorhizobium sp. AG788]|uniref:hypothetical protein n=1 Tax=Azorhizobium sp. AG788 TaxID=2183897 RepID=UPI00105E6560|nr:hypothetical protein [Azorhizobium sp. AG788]TDT94555.1 hypothetical protein DFO45_2305 [Azorhizobium sp. AG788]